MTRPDAATGVFEAHRARLTRLAYRMLGSAAEAEDIVQDAWLRWRRIEMGEVREPAAFLTRTVTRLCLDAMKSARSRRETYVGSWLPEPIVEPEDDTPRLDELTLTLMLALERLSPLERAAFLLHDVFDVALDEVATTLGRDAAAVRQLAVRARKHVRAARPRYPGRARGGRPDRPGLLHGLQQRRSRDAAGDAGTGRDGASGRRRQGARPSSIPSSGWSGCCACSAACIASSSPGRRGLIAPTWIDGLPGYISRERDGVLQTTALAIEDGRITGIYITRNPDKLQRVAEALAPHRAQGSAS